jgi:acyl-coenzyme A thioesterase PaaI-like protein
MPHVVDRELRAVLYKIYSDEMAHISAGKRTLEKIGAKVPGRRNVLLKRASSIFPLHLIPDGLAGERDAIRIVGFQAVVSLIGKTQTEVARYRPGHLLQRWMKVEGYHCIGCHPKRSEGLLLDPDFDSATGEALDIVTFSRRFEGMNDLVHGGFISMALDEVMGYAINHQYNRLAFTTQLEVQFKKPVRVGTPYRISGRVESFSSQRAVVVGVITDPASGAVFAESRASFYVLNTASAEKLLPGALDAPETRAMLEG